MHKYFKNFILCGEIDYLCLLCEEYFQNTSDLEKHIRWEKHRKLMKQQTYLSKFKKDSIYQIGKNFYCEVCNYATQTFDSVKAHVGVDCHKTNKQNPQNVSKTESKMVKRFADCVTISKMVIPKEEWLGVSNKCCCVCNMETASETEEHVSLTSHMVNLLQTQVVEVDNEYYRKIDQKNAYCFECKKTIPYVQLYIHSSDHQNDRENKSNNNNDTQKLYNIDREKNLATCKVCNKTIELRFSNLYNHKTIYHKMSDEQSLEELYEINVLLLTYDHGKHRSDMKKYGKYNYIILNRGGRKGYCSLCGIYLAAHITNFREHVSCVRHTGNLELRGLIKTNKKPEKVCYKTKPFIYYLKDIVLFKDQFAALIDEEYFIQLLSLVFLAPVEDHEKLKCYLCDELISSKNWSHYSQMHQDYIMKTEVITTFSGEFIREIRPSLYHCGFCNLVYPSWRLMVKHLRSWAHHAFKKQSDFAFHEIVTNSLKYSSQEFNKSIHILD